MNKTLKTILITFASVFLIIIIIFIVSFSIILIKSNKINNDYSSIYNDEKYSESVSVEGIDIVTQQYTCGYAVIEMISKWENGDVTEEKLYKKYNKIVTSSSSGFNKEINKNLINYESKKECYLKNTELIDMAYNQIKKGIIVPFTWAAKLDDEWTLHYSIITGMDIKNDKITVANPYGYKEVISVDEFISRTSLLAYDNFPLGYSFGLMFHIIERNTLFILTEK